MYRYLKGNLVLSLKLLTSYMKKNSTNINILFIIFKKLHKYLNMNRKKSASYIYF